MDIYRTVIFFIGSYFIGSIPHLPALARLHGVKLKGDYHSSLWQQAGLWLASLGIIGEFVKGALPVIAGRLLGFELSFCAVAGVLAVCGQMWPVWTHFDGEKGNTIGLAMAASLTTWAMLISIVPLIIGVLIRTIPRLFGPKTPQGSSSIFGGQYSNSLPLGMIITFFVLPFVSLCLHQPATTIAAAAALFILILVRRITAGLTVDLKTDVSRMQIIINRLLYDRPVIEAPASPRTNESHKSVNQPN